MKSATDVETPRCAPTISETIPTDQAEQRCEEHFGPHHAHERAIETPGPRRLLPRGPSRVADKPGDAGPELNNVSLETLLNWSPTSRETTSATEPVTVCNDKGRGENRGYDVTRPQGDISKGQGRGPVGTPALKMERY